MAITIRTCPGRWAMVAALLTCLAAQATPVVVQTSSFDISPVLVTFTVNDPVKGDTYSGEKSAQHAMTFNRFDAALGTLNSVVLEYVTTLSKTSTTDVWTRQTASGQPNNGFSSGTVLAGFMGTMPDVFVAFQHAGTSCTPDPANDGRCTSTLNQSGAVNDQLFLPQAPLIGTGTFSLTALLTNDLTPPVLNDSATVNGTVDSEWRGTLTLTYNYTPAPPVSTVPEPAGLALVTAAALASVATRRRCRT
jgi:hypothetical protein